MPAAAPEALRVISLAQPPAEGEDVSAPFEVIRSGDFMMNGRELKITDETLDAMVANFKRWQGLGAEIPVDYDHSFYEGGESRAAGWFTELVRKGSSLWARVRWTAKAAELIRSGEYRFFSPEWHPNWKTETGAEEGPTMIAGALTNRPFLRGMTPVALSQEAGAAAWAAANLDGVAEAVLERLPKTANFNLPGVRPGSVPVSWTSSGTGTSAISFGGDETRPEVPDPTTATETDEQKAEREAAEARDAEAAAASQRETVTMSRDEAEDLRKRAGEAVELKTSVEALSSRVDGLSSDLQAERFSADFGEALRQGRVDAKDETRQTWKDRYEKFGRDEARALLFELPAETIPITERGSGGQNVVSDAPEGVDSEAHELDVEVKAYQADHEGVSYSQAYDAIIASRREKAAA